MTSNLEKFKDRLKNIEQNRFKKKPEAKGLGIGMKIGLDLISPIVVGILIGLGFDKIFFNKTYIFFNFFAIRNHYRLYKCNQIYEVIKINI